MKRLVVLLVLWMLFSDNSAIDNVTGDDRAISTTFETRLTKKLIDDYEVRGVYGRPVQNVQDVIRIDFGLSLLQVIELDEKNQVLTLNVWDTCEWNDTFTTWDPDEYGGITDVRIPGSKLWRPDIKLYNYADERIDDHRDSLAIVYHNGFIRWMPQVIYKSSCPIGIRYFPFDEQYCSLKFGSWTYDGSKLDIGFVDGRTAFELTNYISNNGWMIVENSAAKNLNSYACCPEIYQDLTFKLRLRRRAVFYTYILILPCVLLSTLTLVLFWIPPESPAKIQLGMNIFVAFFVLVLILEESIPAAASVPLIGTYYSVNMILITLSAFLNVLVVNLFKQGSESQVPEILRKIFLGVLARALCIRRPSGHKVRGQTTAPTSHRYEDPDVDTMEKFSLTNNHTTTPYSSETPVLENAVREINHNVNRLTAKSQEKERRAAISEEWKTIARVLDRIYFIVYLIIGMVAFLVLVP